MPRLSFTGKRWHVTGDLSPAPHIPVPETAGVILRSLVTQRGMSSVVPRHIGIDASVFPDISKVIDRVTAALQANETIAVFGDYDCDGITSSAILQRFFERRGVTPIIKLPHRLREGYGLKLPHVTALAEQHVTLLITVDTGVSALKEIEEANRHGMDVIVIDHHHVPQTLPAAYAIIHPHVATGTIVSLPAAAGLAFSVVRALEHSMGNATWDGMQTDIALAAMGTVADLVELQGENRSLVTAGTEALSTMMSGPLRFFMTSAGIDGQVTSRDIAFRLAPRVNAAGRMADPKIALQALLGHQESLLELEKLNFERQQTVLNLFDEAMTTVDTSAPFLCLMSEAYSPGIVGLIAGKLTEKFGKPSLVAAVVGDLCMASLRSIPDYHVTQGLERCGDLLTSFGGHAQAAGCSFPIANFQDLQKRLVADAAERIPADALFPFLMIDGLLDARYVTQDLCSVVDNLEPFGQGNPEPRFLLPSVMLQDVRRVGKELNHLQAKLGRAKLIGFHLGHMEDMVKQSVDIVCRLSIDTWNGNETPQLMLDDVGVNMTIQESDTAKTKGVSITY